MSAPVPEQRHPTDAVAFRPATEADRRLLSDLVTRYYEHDRHEIDPAVIGSALDAALGGDVRINIVVIEVDGAPAGYMALSTGFSMESGGPDGCVDEIYLEQHARGRGIGARALAHAETVFRNLGVRRVYLEVEKHNPGAEALYRRAGFTETGRHLMSKWLERPAG